MKKYFIDLNWVDEYTPLLHLKDYENKLDEFVSIPEEFNAQRINEKICIGTLNPATREYISCNNIVDKSECQCNTCKYLFDFYKCVRCHGEDCYVKNVDVLKYCNTSHYVYLAYFSSNKIKVGTASEVKKYDRLLEQGALFSIFIAKTPTGKVARQIENGIINSGISGAVTINYKMKNIVCEDDYVFIRKILFEKYKEILNIITEDNRRYLIDPEFKSFTAIHNKINRAMLLRDDQMSLFSQDIHKNRNSSIKKSFENISGKYLFAIGKILGLEVNGEIELINTKKLEGCLFDFKNIKSFSNGNEKKF